MAVKILVPATSANVGAGFDALGLALSLHNTVTMEEWDKLDIMASDGSLVPTGTSNLIYRSAKAVYEQLGKPIKGLRIRQENPIPMARGLGSSSACIVAGILGANALLGSPLTKRQMPSGQRGSRHAGRLCEQRVRRGPGFYRPQGDQ